jgi:hypothetical protein
MIALNYLGTSFVMLSFEKGLNFGRAMYYYISIIIIVLLVLSKTFNLVGYAKKI